MRIIHSTYACVERIDALCADGGAGAQQLEVDGG